MDEPQRLGGSDEGFSPTGYLVTFLAGGTAVIINRVARDMKLEFESLKVKSIIVYSPRGIAGQESCPSQPTGVWLRIDADAGQVEALKADYFRCCPVYNLFKAAGCKMTDTWHANE